MTLCIERFEGDKALCERESGGTVCLDRADLPPGAREGDILREVDGRWAVDPEETAKRRRDNYRLQQRLLSRKKPG